MHIAGGTLGPPWNNSIAAYLNGGTIEYSVDAITWTFYATIAGVSDLPNSPKIYYPQVTAQYWRITRPTFLAISEWRFFSQIDEAIMPIVLSGEFSELIPDLINTGLTMACESTELSIESMIAGLSFSMTVTEITPINATLSINVKPTVT